MTIIEAIKSGKRLRRPSSTTWLSVDRDGKFLENVDEGVFSGITVDMVLADDWEVEEKKVEITKSDVVAAYCRVPLFARENGFVDAFIKELGL